MKYAILLFVAVFNLLCSFSNTIDDDNIKGVWFSYTPEYGYLEFGIEDSTIYYYESERDLLGVMTYSLVGDSVIMNKGSKVERTAWYKKFDDFLKLEYGKDILVLKKMNKNYKYNILWQSNLEKINEQLEFAIRKEALYRRFEIITYQHYKSNKILDNRVEYRKEMETTPENLREYRGIDLIELWNIIDEAYPDDVYMR